jgi:hypothetical protein
VKAFYIIIWCCIVAACWTAPAVCADVQPAEMDSDVVTIPRTQFEALKDRLDQLEKQLAELQQRFDQRPTPATTPSESSQPSEEAQTPSATPTSGGGKYLALPDISFVAQSVGKVSSDRRDTQRNRLRLREAEIGIQGYVYPNVKADAFIAMSPQEDEAAQVEEAYLSYIGLANGFSAYLGKKHVPFGRTNLTHSHSWLYVEQPLVLRNLVSAESLSGEGIGVSYLLPTKSQLFAQLDLGTWTGAGESEPSDLPDIVAGPGAGFDRFYTARLWTSYPVTAVSELELGGSYAHGQIAENCFPGSGHTTLSGIDASYRHFGDADSRLLLRAEAFRRKDDDLPGSRSASGYYLFGNLRQNKYSSWGVLYDWSEFPQAPDLHESKASLIWTKQMSEQYYLRLQACRGSRPGDSSYTELLVEWVWGVGPHTHSLE